MVPVSAVLQAGQLPAERCCTNSMLGRGSLPRPSLAKGRVHCSRRPEAPRAARRPIRNRHVRHRVFRKNTIKQYTVNQASIVASSMVCVQSSAAFIQSSGT